MGMRIFTRLSLIVVPLCLTVSCGVASGSGPVVLEPVPGWTAPAEPTGAQPTGAGSRPGSIDPEAVRRAAVDAEPDTVLGAVVVDRVTGTLPLAIDSDRQFRSASLVKLLIAIDAVERDADEQDRERLATMLTLSDDMLASAFWMSGGGPDIVRRTSAAIGLTGTEPPDDPGRWGETLLTPADVARVYDHVLRLPAADRDLIVDALARTPRVAADGFDQHFGIPDGLASPWAVKQGWGNNDTTEVLHSTGLAGPQWRYIVVLLTEHPRAARWSDSARAVTSAAAALHGHLPGI